MTTLTARQDFDQCTIPVPITGRNCCISGGKKLALHSVVVTFHFKKTTAAVICFLTKNTGLTKKHVNNYRRGSSLSVRKEFYTENVSFSQCPCLTGRYHDDNVIGSLFH